MKQKCEREGSSRRRDNKARRRGLSVHLEDCNGWCVVENFKLYAGAVEVRVCTGDVWVSSEVNEASVVTG